MRCLLLLVASLSLLLAPRRAAADSWMFPRPMEGRSDNGKWIARTTPRAKDRPPLITVSPADPAAGGAGAAPPAWQATLSNAASPLEVFVCDDGKHVVTLDNWYGVSGDDDVAFYDAPGQQVRRYAVLDVLPPPRTQREEFERMILRVSSRSWRGGGGIEFFHVDEEHDRTERFAVWLHERRRWLTWNSATGEAFEPGEGLIMRLNDAARQRMLRRMEGYEAITAMRFLALQRVDGDRALIARHLDANDFHTGQTMIYDLPDEPTEAYLFAESYLRKTADEALATWDNEPVPAHGEYRLLGQVRGAIKLPRGAGRTGRLNVYLVPADVPFAQWHAAPRPQRLFADFAETWMGDSQERRHFIKRGVIQTRFGGVTPGRYWVKAVLDVARPHGGYDTMICVPSSGDYQSVELRMITVRAGEAADFGTLPCVARARR